MKTERGNVGVLVAAAVVLCGLLCVGFARLESAATAKARAETAADAAALAAASALGDGESPGAVMQAAQRTAAQNGARLVTCRCTGTDAVVTVAVDAAQARARATVNSPPFG